MGQTPHCPSGSSWRTVRGRHERSLHKSLRSAKLHFWMCPDATRESRADPSTELGLLRARAHLSVTVPCKSDLVLSIWHPNAPRALTAPHSHTRGTQGSSVYTWRLLHNEQPLGDRKMEPARASLVPTLPRRKPHPGEGAAPRGRPVTHRWENQTSPRRLPCSTDGAQRWFSSPKSSPRSPYCVWSTSRLNGGAKMADQGTAWQPEAVLPPQ